MANANHYKQAAIQAANKYGIPANYFVNQIAAESNFNPNARSPAGAMGIAQIMPGTARGWRVNPMDPMAALDAAARNMAQYSKQYGGYRNALVAYNAGPGRVGKPLYAETAGYIQKILGGQKPSPVRPITAQPAAAKFAYTPAAIAARNAPRLQMQAYDPVKLADDQLRTLAMTSENGSAADLIRTTNQSRLMENEETNTKARTYNAMLDAKAMEMVAAVAPALMQQRKPGPGAAMAQRKGEPGWRYLQRMGQTKFGLQNDPGNSQTFGGRHSAGSEHGWDKPNAAQVGRAVDFGTARNSRAKLNAWMKWAKAQGLDALWEGDHAHVSMPGRGI